MTDATKHIESCLREVAAQVEEAGVLGCTTAGLQAYALLAIAHELRGIRHMLALSTGVEARCVPKDGEGR